MAGKNYVMSREAMRNLSEAVNRIRLDKFKDTYPDIFSSAEHNISDILDGLEAAKKSNKTDSCHESWEVMQEIVEKSQFLAQFSAFNDEMGGKSELWRYWNIFLDKIMPVAIDLTKSFRNGDNNVFAQKKRSGAWLSLLLSCI